jgi:hypothetical protein
LRFLLKLLLVTAKSVIITLVFEKNAIFFAEDWQKSQKIVIITSTPGDTKLYSPFAVERKKNSSQRECIDKNDQHFNTCIRAKEFFFVTIAKHFFRFFAGLPDGVFSDQNSQFG